MSLYRERQSLLVMADSREEDPANDELADEQHRRASRRATPTSKQAPTNPGATISPDPAPTNPGATISPDPDEQHRRRSTKNPGVDSDQTPANFR
nr:hypothetical protein CFP56_30584 [Quercus suber]